MCVDDGKEESNAEVPFSPVEDIFGYKGLDVHMSVMPCSLKMLFSPKWNVCISDIPTMDATPTDIHATFSEFLPQEHFTNKEAFLEALKEDSDFRPFGERVHTYAVDNATYDIYTFTSTTPDATSYIQNWEALIPFFIDGGSLIDLHDPRWHFYVTFLHTPATNTAPETYHSVAFCSMYKFYAHPDQWRMRISQFLALPRFVGKGHGKRLYRCIVDAMEVQPDVVEVNVEEPNEAFADMRDRVDLARIREHPDVLKSLTLPLKASVLTDVQRQFKLNKRQAERCIEMLLLNGNRKRKSEKEYRVQVKKRLFRFNADALSQLEPEERIEKLNETYKSVVEDYERILSK